MGAAEWRVARRTGWEAITARWAPFFALLEGLETVPRAHRGQHRRKRPMRYLRWAVTLLGGAVRGGQSECGSAAVADDPRRCGQARRFQARCVVVVVAASIVGADGFRGAILHFRRRLFSSQRRLLKLKGLALFSVAARRPGIHFAKVTTICLLLVSWALPET